MMQTMMQAMMLFMMQSEFLHKRFDAKTTRQKL